MSQTDANTQSPPSSPKKGFQFTYQQTKRISELLQQKLHLTFWINLTKDEQEQEKSFPTDNHYYRLAFCKYNGFDLLNIVRYHPDKTRVPKGKAYTTINLKAMKCTMNSINKYEFTNDEKATIKTTLGLE